MTPHSFWTFILKISGLYFLYQSISVIPQGIGSIIMTLQATNGEMHEAILYILFTLAFYVIFLWLFLFKSEWIINKFKLDKHFREERFELNINRNSIIQIAIILIGANIIIDTIPQFCSQVFLYFKSKSVFREDTDIKWLSLNVVKLILGYLLISNNRKLTTIFEHKKRSGKQTS